MTNSQSSPKSRGPQPAKIYEKAEAKPERRVIPVEVATRFGVDPALYSDASVAHAVSKAQAAQLKKKWDPNTLPKSN
ncbi:hypothetical protein [Glutamicibacter sp.]|uniref:hypothetical protein n=1 Tax=Glutamicibacter sp. TaxID=1931995 RepID=UPI0028BD8ECF|nr:hypothetical protein [Glutamicibacter sp.]